MSSKSDTWPKLPIMRLKDKVTKEYVNPLQIFQINDTYILAIYQGNISKFDMLLKYRQRNSKNKSGWSNQRTPRHIHWAVDILIKMHQDKKLTKKLVTFLLSEWNKTIAHKTKKQRLSDLTIKKLIPRTAKEAKQFYKLNKYGEYSVKFLLLMAKLLMQQEKNNLKTAYMFRKLLEKLEAGEDIFSIVQSATYRGGR